MSTFAGHVKWSDPKYKHHVAELKRRGITVEEAIEREYEPLTAEETRKETWLDDAEAIAITSRRADGTPQEHRQLRLLVPKVDANGKEQRYTQRRGTGSIIHVRRPRKNAQVAYLTEGVFKADAIYDAHGGKVVAVSVPGVTSFRLSGELHPEIVAALKDVDTVKFCYDTDQQEKLTVIGPLFEAAELVRPLVKAMKFVQLPAVPNLEKTGADDLIQHDRQGFLGAPEHDYGSPWADGQRRRIAKATADAPKLPAALRDLTPVPRAWYDEKPRPPEYVVEGLWQTEEVAILAGPGGTGKTYFTLPMCIAIATGLPFFAFHVPRARRVLYIMCERSEMSFRRRWHKVARAAGAGLDPGPLRQFERLLHENAYARSLGGATLELVEFREQQWQVSPALEGLIAEIRTAGIEVVFLDPLSRLHGGNENDAAAMAAVIRALERIVTETGAAVLFSHHTGKTVRDDQYIGRGSSALTDNTSETLGLTLIEPAERANLDLAALGSNRQLWDVVRLRHHRASDGPRVEDAYFARDPATGLLERVPVRSKSPEERLAAFIANVRAWWATDATRQGKPITARQVRDAYREIDPRLKKADAEALFTQAAKSGRLGAEVRVTNGHGYMLGGAPGNCAAGGDGLNGNALGNALEPATA